MVLRVEAPVALAQPCLSGPDRLTPPGTAIGVTGQGPNPTATTRLRDAAGCIARAGRRIMLAVDGGIREGTVPVLRGAGAEKVVLGSLAYGAPDLAARLAWLQVLPG